MIQEKSQSIHQHYQSLLQYIQGSLFVGIPYGTLDNLHIIVDEITDKEIEKIGAEIYPYNKINNLKLSLRISRKKKCDISYQLKLLSYLISNLRSVENLIIIKQAEAISTEYIITMLKEIQNSQSLMKLSVEMLHFNETYDQDREYQIRLFGQEIGMFTQLSELNLGMKQFQITKDNIFSIFQGIRECIYLQKFGFSLELNSIGVEGFAALKDLILQTQSIKGLTLELSQISTICEYRKLFQEIMFGLTNLEAIAFNVETYEEEKQQEGIENLIVPEKEQIINDKIKSFTFLLKIHENRRNRNRNIEQTSIYLSSFCTNLVELNVGLQECNSKQILQFAEIIQNKSSIENLQLELANYKNEQVFKELCKAIKSLLKLEKLHISFAKATFTATQDMEVLSQIFSSNENVQDLKINLLYSILNKDMLNILSKEISKVSHLKNLKLIASRGIIVYIDTKQFFRNLQHNINLRTFTFDFTVQQSKSFKTIRTNDEYTFQGYCGTYLLQRGMQRREALGQMKVFKQLIQQGIRKMERLVIGECICKRYYTPYPNNITNTEYYSYIESDNEDI